MTLVHCRVPCPGHTSRHLRNAFACLSFGSSGPIFLLASTSAHRSGLLSARHGDLLRSPERCAEVLRRGNIGPEELKERHAKALCKWQQSKAIRKPGKPPSLDDARRSEARRVLLKEIERKETICRPS